MSLNGSIIATVQLDIKTFYDQRKSGNPNLPVFLDIFQKDFDRLQKIETKDASQIKDIERLSAELQMFLGKIRSALLSGPPQGSGQPSALGGSSGASGLSDARKDESITFHCEDWTTPGKDGSPAKAWNLPRETFNDIVGMQREKQELRVGFLYPTLYPNLFPTGGAILFFGPAGGGKSYLVKAVPRAIDQVLQTDFRNETGMFPDHPLVCFFNLTGADLKSGLLGGTEKNIEAAWDCAENTAVSVSPAAIAIMFIDEIDVIGAKRTGSDPTITSSVTALLVAMQGIKTRDHVRVIGATNRPTDLDEAVLSRFPIKIFVDTPGDLSRQQLFVENFVKQANRGRVALLQNLRGLLASLKLEDSREEFTSRQIEIMKSILKNTVQLIAQSPTEYRFIFDTLKKSVDSKESGSPKLDQIFAQSIDLLQKNKKTRDFAALLNDIKNALEQGSKRFKFLQWEDIFGKQDPKDFGDESNPNSFAAFLKANSDKMDSKDPKQLSSLILTWMVVQTGMNSKGKQRLIKSFSDQSRAERTVNMFLVGAGKHTMGGRSEFGYSNRDLSNLINYIIGKAALQFLHESHTFIKPDGSKITCIPQLSDEKSADPKCRESDPGTCTVDRPCDACSSCIGASDRALLRPTNIKVSDVMAGLDQISSGVNPGDYVNSVLYKFQEEAASQAQQTIKEKEREGKNEAEVLFGHLFEDATPESVILALGDLPEKLSANPLILKVAGSQILKAPIADVVKQLASRKGVPVIKPLLDTVIQLTAGDEDKQRKLKALL
jgi:AAA+ superfamily predicted ATPase